MNLSARIFDEDSIHAVLQNVAFSFRATYHSILRSSPGQLVFGRDMIVCKRNLRRKLEDNQRSERKEYTFEQRP